MEMTDERMRSMTKKLYNLMNWQKIEEIIYSECDNPHDLLGPHNAGRQTLIQAYFPGAKKAFVEFEATGEKAEMELADEDGFFARGSHRFLTGRT